VNIAGYDHDEPMIYGKLAIEAHDAKIRAAAVHDAAERAVQWLKYTVPYSYIPAAIQAESNLRAYILAGEVKG